MALETQRGCGYRRIEGTVWKPGVFHIFQPRRVVRIIPSSMGDDERQRLRAEGIDLVEVPADDPDHQPTKGREA